MLLKFSFYRKDNTTRLYYKDQFVNALQGNSYCLFSVTAC
jgi:hypothetical protein